MHFSFCERSTERLLLRRLERTDAPQIFKLRSDEEVNRYLGRPIAKSLDDASAFIDRILLAPGNEQLYWAICLKTDNELIGTICCWNIRTEKRSAEIGFEMLPAFQGKGYMQEAITAVLDFVFTKAGFVTIEAVPVGSNLRSVRLLQKNNFSRDLYGESQFSEEEKTLNLQLFVLRHPGEMK